MPPIAEISTGNSTHLAPACPPLFGHPRDYLNNRFVYVVISQRGRGLSIGLNLTPNRKCNFDCIYCEVDHNRPVQDQEVDVKVLARELRDMLKLVAENRIASIPWLRAFPPEWLELKEVAISGDGEPTLCPKFHEVVETNVLERARARQFFKIVLITNSSGLDIPEVQRGLQLFGKEDEVWLKLDAGTQAYMNRINRPAVSLQHVTENILRLGRTRPVIIQSLFPQVGSAEPTPKEVVAYIKRLKDLSDAGAQIKLVQVYSAHRPPHRPDCVHLPLKTLSEIARRIREETGIKAEVF